MVFGILIFNKIIKQKINYKIKIINPKITIDRFFNTEDAEPLLVK